MNKNSRREGPSLYQMKAREMFLDCHKTKISVIYRFPDNKLRFDDSITEVMYKGKLAGKCCFKYLNSDKGNTNISKVRKEHKKRLESILTNPTDDFREDWFVHLDYESLIMDKLIDFDRVPANILVTSENMTFFERNYLFKLMHQGYKVANTTDKYSPRSQWFSQWNDEWFAKYALTKHRLIDILENFSEAWIADFIESNKPRYDNLNDIYNRMKEIHRNKLINSAKNRMERDEFISQNPELRNYADFVAQAMDYNEELRTYRSVAVWNFLQGCKAENINPYNEFIRLIDVRKKRIEEEYASR